MTKSEIDIILHDIKNGDQSWRQTINERFISFLEKKILYFENESKEMEKFDLGCSQIFANAAITERKTLNDFISGSMVIIPERVEFMLRIGFGE